MERNALLQADYLDILFDRRNKIYGGYELRKHYPQRIKKAISAVLISTSLICAYSVFGNTTKPDNVVVHDYHPRIIDPPPLIEHPEKPIILPPDPPKSDLATADFAQLKVVADNQVREDEKPTENNDLKNKMIGDANREGDATTSDISVPAGERPGTGDITVIETFVPPAAPVTWVEQMPQFNGDIEKYLSENIHYPEQARETGIEGRVAVQFVVTENGDITDAKIIRGIGGGCSEEALRVVKSMPRWKPGKNNGRAVKVQLTLPVTFHLQ